MSTETPDEIADRISLAHPQANGIPVDHSDFERLHAEWLDYRKQEMPKMVDAIKTHGLPKPE